MTATNLIPMAEMSHKWLPQMRSLRIHKKKQHSNQFHFEGISTVNQLLKKTRVNHSKRLLLGYCMDGLPLFWDMNAPEVGAILIGCDAGSGKTHQLQVMVESVLKSKLPGEVQLQILTLNPTDWDSLVCRDTSGIIFGNIHAWYDIRIEANIKSLADLVESRHEGRLTEPTILLILDDLHAVEDLSFEAQFNLRYLLEYGPQSNVWVVATINTEQIADYGYWIETFRTKIVGRMRSPEAAEVFHLTPNSQATLLEPGAFRVWADDQWLLYRLPLLGG